MKKFEFEAEKDPAIAAQVGAKRNNEIRIELDRLLTTDLPRRARRPQDAARVKELLEEQRLRGEAEAAHMAKISAPFFETFDKHIEEYMDEERTSDAAILEAIATVKKCAQKRVELADRKRTMFSMYANWLRKNGDPTKAKAYGELTPPSFTVNELVRRFLRTAGV